MNEKVKALLQKRIVIFLIIVFVVVIFLKVFIAEPICVRGVSMVPTLENGDYICIEKLSYCFHEPKRNDIVVVRTTYNGKKQEYVKRIIGLPGEKVRIKKGLVYINGKPLEEIKEFDAIEDGGMARNAIKLQDGEYFMLGDNRNNSKDSRNVELGIVDFKQINGKLLFRSYPFNKIGKVE